MHTLKVRFWVLTFFSNFVCMRVCVLDIENSNGYNSRILRKIFVMVLALLIDKTWAGEPKVSTQIKNEKKWFILAFLFQNIWSILFDIFEEHNSNKIKIKFK